MKSESNCAVFGRDSIAHIWGLIVNYKKGGIYAITKIKGIPG